MDLPVNVCGVSEKLESLPNATPNTSPSDPGSVTPPSASMPTLGMMSRQTGDSKPPQAIVKPQILTHIIEGFVIQEGAEPFPVRGSRVWSTLSTLVVVVVVVFDQPI